MTGPRQLPSAIRARLFLLPPPLSLSPRSRFLLAPLSPRSHVSFYVYPRERHCRPIAVYARSPLPLPRPAECGNRFYVRDTRTSVKTKESFALRTIAKDLPREEQTRSSPVCRASPSSLMFLSRIDESAHG